MEDGDHSMWRMEGILSEWGLKTEKLLAIAGYLSPPGEDFKTKKASRFKDRTAANLSRQNSTANLARK